MPTRIMTRPRTLCEIHALTYWDIVLDNDRKLRIIPKEERKIREQLILIAEQHERWWKHVAAVGKHDMGDGTFIYLNQSRPPWWMTTPYPSTEVWVNYVSNYRAEWWRKTIGCEFNPMCPCKSPQFCGCLPFARGVRLIDGATELDPYFVSDNLMEQPSYIRMLEEQGK